MQEYIDAVNMDVMITEIGIFVAGFAAVLGIWLERDKTKPPRYAWWLSILIMLATFVGMFQTLADAKEGAKLEADMARMLATLDKIAQTSDVEIPALNEFVKNEVSAQARSNPDVVKKVAQRIADEGGDPAAMLSSYLPPSEVQQVARKGALTTKTVKVALPASGKGGDGATAENKPKRRKLEFGGKARLRSDDGDKGSDKAKDDDAPRKLKIGGRDGADDEDGDAKDGDEGGPRKLKIGGRDKDEGADDAKDDKKGVAAPKTLGGLKAPGGGVKAPPSGGRPGGAPAGGLKGTLPKK
jgi:hypothetical protein